jgi:hypothetical protein
MALIRSYTQIEEMRRAGELTPAEERLLAECQSGELVVFGDGMRPKRATPERTIRADLLRYLILGGCEQFRTHEHGIRVHGAWIDGLLDLSETTAHSATVLRDCVFPDGISVTRARLKSLDLTGGRLKSLAAADCNIAGDLTLDEIETRGTVNLAGARIAGHLSCMAVKLNGCGGMAIDAGRLRVGKSFVWRQVAYAKGCVNLAFARVGTLVDDWSGLKAMKKVRLVGLTYDRIDGSAHSERVRWLRTGSYHNGKFHFQPYDQLIGAFGRSGDHEAETAVRSWRKAQKRREARERLLREADSPLQRIAIRVRNLPYRIWSGLVGTAVGFGLRPWSAIWILLFYALMQTPQIRADWSSGRFVPASEAVLLSDEWRRIVNASSPPVTNPSATWMRHTEAGRSYQMFNSELYAFDMLLPFVDLGQESAWVQLPARGWRDRFSDVLQKVQLFLTWVVAAIFVGALTGIIRHDD